MMIASEIEALVSQLGQAAVEAGRELALCSQPQKNTALHAMAVAMRTDQETILAANAKDMALGRDKGLTATLLDRLLLTPSRIEGMACGLEAIAAMADPIGKVIAEWTQPNGLHIQRVCVPLGVIGFIYESRPNVTVDAGGLCLKSGNAVILRGGSESFYSSQALVACLHRGLEKACLPKAAIQLIPTIDRAAVGALLRAVGLVDVIIPRGGKSLIARVQQESQVPVLAHLEGLCHTYIHNAADPEKAKALVLNAKMRRPGVCGATETVLVDRAVAAQILPPILSALLEAGCALRGCAEICALNSAVMPACEADWSTEYLDAILSMRVVSDLEEAITHIMRYGSQHTDCIVTENNVAAEAFMQRLDSAILLVNASTQFADGGEFGMGAEIGIATGRLHVRGPVGAAELTIYKYKVYGTGQTRP